MSDRFTSRRERRLWAAAGLVLLAIASTLAFSTALSDVFTNRELMDDISVLGFALVATGVLVLALRPTSSVAEVGVVIAVLAAYLLVFFRAASPIERSHLFEYSALALLVYEALRERSANGQRPRRPALLAVGLTGAVGVLDEVAQLAIPNRVFDGIDIVFNLLAVAMGVVASLVFVRVQRWTSRGD